MSSSVASNYRPLLRNLVRRDVRLRYKGSIFGVAWTLITPLVTVGAYWLVFRFLFGSPIPNYALFLFVGLTVWAFFYTGIQSASVSITQNASLVTKNSFPREIIPISSIAANGVTVVAMLVIAIPLCLIFRQGSLAPLVLLPVIAIFLVAMTVGLGLLLAGLNVYFRDVSHILTALAIPWFFLTPIFYSYSTLPELGGNQDAIVFVLQWVNFVSPYVVATQDAPSSGCGPGSPPCCTAGSWVPCSSRSASSLSDAWPERWQWSSDGAGGHSTEGGLTAVQGGSRAEPDSQGNPPTTGSIQALGALGPQGRRSRYSPG